MSTLTLLLKQHIGTSCSPVCAPGDAVRRGQVVAEAGQGLGVPLHAPLDGKITAVNDTSITLDTAEPVMLQAFSWKDEEHLGRAEAETKESTAPDTHFSREAILEAARNAGLVGLGGAGFPTHVKIAANTDGGVLIANGAECEPLLHHNITQLVCRPETTRRGMLLAAKACNASRIVLAVKGKHAAAIAAMRHVVRPDDPIEIFPLPDVYPSGEERALVRDIIGTLLAPDQLPSAANAVVLNVETLYRLALAVEDSQPLTSKDVTVAGRNLNDGGKPGAVVFHDVPIGLPLHELLHAAGGAASGHGEIILGGPFTGRPADTSEPVQKTTGGIVVTAPFPAVSEPVGLLVCACSANAMRMRELAKSIGAPIAASTMCIQAKAYKGVLKCANPGHCPQGHEVEITQLLEGGAKTFLLGTCTECTASIAKKCAEIGVPVMHSTDHARAAVGLEPFAKTCLAL